jgi:membrane protein implicated in regulation of membrane protease activity
VSVDGELWQARSRAPLAAGDEARVVAVSNLTLRVEPLARSIASDDSP